MCQVPFSCPSGVMVLSEVAGCALHDGFRGQIVIKCVQRDLSLIQTLEIDRPPSLPDMVSAASFEQKFGLALASIFGVKSVPFFHSVSIKTAILRAVAMVALRNPFRPARRIAHDFKAE